jgi:hypothetical protein
MAAGFGFCANCGTPASAPDEKFCASCGAAMPAHAAAPMASAPPPYAPPPSAPQPYAPQPYAPQPYAPPQYAPPPVQPAWGAPPMGAPVAPARTAVNPVVLIAGLLVIVAIVGVGAFAFVNGSKSSGSPGANGHPGTLAFSPSTVSCDDTLTITTTLPSSVKDSDPVTLKVDGNATGTHTVVEAGLTKQSDGSWSGTASGPPDCSMGPGLHTEQLVDATGKVLAEGSFTISGATASGSAEETAESTATAKATAKATKTPKPTKTPRVTPPAAGSSVVIDPDSFSCSAAAINVTLTVTLSASFSSSDEVTAVIDGSVGETGTVGDIFTQQADGSWSSSTTNTSKSLCGSYDPGDHTIGFQDSGGSMIAEGSFTVLP